MKKVDDVVITTIDVGERHRPIDRARVKELAASMKEFGLLQPITLCASDSDKLWLVAGIHRLEAAKELGWSCIDALYVRGDEIARELMEIAENLHRVDLTQDERNQHIRRYAELIAKKREIGVVPQDAVKLSTRGRANEGRPKSITKEIAEATGLSDDTIRRALKPKQEPPKVIDYEAETAAEIEREYDGLLRAWGRARSSVRQRFREEVVDTPLMDAA